MVPETGVSSWEEEDVSSRWPLPLISLYTVPLILPPSTTAVLVLVVEVADVGADAGDSLDDVDDDDDDDVLGIIGSPVRMS